jgi:homocysteine S-methyltransferase
MSFAVDDLLERNHPVILDGGIGTELQRLGAPMDHEAWCAVALDTHPDLVRQVHRSYIEAGADIITVNAYATTRQALKSAGMEEQFTRWNIRAVQIARETLDDSASERDILIAGSVSTFGNFNRFSDAELEPYFQEQAEILAENGVDLVILETLSSRASTIVTALNALADFDLPVWVAISGVQDRNSGALYLGVEESPVHSNSVTTHEPFADAIQKIMAEGGSALLLMHSPVNVCTPGLEVMSENYSGVLGAYPNAGYWQRPDWAFVDQITPADYLKAAGDWIDAGAKIVGGCCGIGPAHISALSAELRDR